MVEKVAASRSAAGVGQKAANGTQNLTNGNRYAAQTTDRLPVELTPDTVRQPPIALSDKLIIHVTNIEGNKNCGIFYDYMAWDTYSVVLGYTRDESRLIIDTIKFRDDIPHNIGARLIEIARGRNYEADALKNSNVIEGVMKFCVQNGLQIFTTSTLLKTIADTYGKVKHPHFIEILPLEEGKKINNGLPVERIPVQLRKPAD